MFTEVELRRLAEEKRADAAKARRWARSIFTLANQDRMLQLAEELEREAEALERQDGVPAPENAEGR
jgi:hypothetical protein